MNGYQAGMPSPADLLSLVAHLRRNGFNVSPGQFSCLLFLARSHRLDIKSAAQSDLTKRLIAPVVCKSAEDQKRIHPLVDSWITGNHSVGVRQAPLGETANKTEVRVVGSSIGWSLPAFFTLALAVIASSAWVSWNESRIRPFVIAIKTASPASGSEVPLSAVSVTAGRCTGITDARGNLRCSVATRELPVVVIASKGGVRVEKLAYPEIDDWRARRFLTLDVFHEIPETAIVLKSFEPPAASMQSPEKTLLLRPGMTLEPPPLPEGNVAIADYRSFIELLVGISAIFALAAIAFRGTTVSRRSIWALPGRTKALAKRISFQLPALTAAIRVVSKAMRLLDRSGTTNLLPNETIKATVAKGGLFAPVYGGARERQFVVILNRQSPQDHYAFIAEALVAELHRNGVDIAAYEFQTHGSMLYPILPWRRRSTDGAGTIPKSVPIDQVFGETDGSPVLVFSDASAFVDGIRPEIVNWAQPLLKNSSPTIFLTPMPMEWWGVSEARLQAHGTCCRTLTPTSLSGLSSLLAPNRLLVGSAVSSFPIGDASLLRSEFQLHRAEPPEVVIRQICDVARGYLGNNGFRWLQACAVYPAIQWPITVGIGRLVVPDELEREQLLIRLSGLVWFRHAHMPDWLRRELILCLLPSDEIAFRRYYRQIFEAGHSHDNTSLARAVEGVTFRLPALKRARAWLSSQLALRATLATCESVTERIFLDFLEGARQRPIDLELRSWLAYRLGGWPRPGAVLSVGLYSVTLAAITAWWFGSVAPGLAVSDHIIRSAALDDSGEGVVMLSGVRGGPLTNISSRNVARGGAWQDIDAKFGTEDFKLDAIQIAPGSKHAALMFGGEAIVIRIGLLHGPMTHDERIFTNPYSPSFSANGEFLAVANDQQITLYSVNGLEVSDATPKDAMLTANEPIKRALVDSRGVHVLGLSDKETLGSFLTPRSLVRRYHSLAAAAFGTTSRGKFISCTNSDGSAKIEYMTVLSDISRQAPYLIPQTKCTAIAMSEGENFILVGSSRGQAFLLDAELRSLQELSFGYGGTSPVERVSFSKDMNSLMVFRSDGTVSYASIKEITTPKPPPVTGPLFRREELVSEHLERLERPSSTGVEAPKGSAQQQEKLDGTISFPAGRSGQPPGSSVVPAPTRTDPSGGAELESKKRTPMRLEDAVEKEIAKTPKPSLQDTLEREAAKAKKQSVTTPKNFPDSFSPRRDHLDDPTK